MRRWQVILIIVSVLIILSIGGFFIYKALNTENEDWLYGSGDEFFEEMIFNDVPKTHWASEYISYLSQREIMFASGDGYFYPDRYVTFEEFLETVLRVSLGKLDIDNLSGEGFIKVLEKNEVFKEGEIGIEKLSKILTKAEVAVVLAKVDMKIRNNSQKIAILNYEDLDELDEISKTLIGHSVERGFFELKADDKFYPNTVISRAELAEIIYLFLNK